MMVLDRLEPKYPLTSMKKKGYRAAKRKARKVSRDSRRRNRR